jgi:hypothetical protein
VPAMFRIASRFPMLRVGPRFQMRSIVSLCPILGIASLSCLGAHAQQRDIFAFTGLNPAVAVTAPVVTTPIDVSGEVSIPFSAAPDELPDAPQPQGDMAALAALDPIDSVGPQQTQRPTAPGFPPVSPTPRPLPRPPSHHPGIPSEPPACLENISRVTPVEISCSPNVDYFQRFVEAGIHPLTAREKAYLALRNATDPYNFATVAFLSAVSVASDSHSAYGPGMAGFARNFGVAYNETVIGEFFGTFLIPALTHQDPHYHRLPNASYGRRIVHAVTQVVWAQSDYGVPMPNYSNLITTAVSIGLGNLYVPGRDTSWGTSTKRYVTAIATAPIGNAISEFLPDVAQRVNVRIVLVQRIIDRVQRENGGS